MGSKGLWAFIQPIIKRIPLENLKNKRLIIDIILYLHKQIIGIRNKGHDIINNRGKNINHLVSLYHILKNLINVDIKAIDKNLKNVYSIIKPAKTKKYFVLYQNDFSNMDRTKTNNYYYVNFS